MDRNGNKHVWKSGNVAVGAGQRSCDCDTEAQWLQEYHHPINIIVVYQLAFFCTHNS